MANTIGRWTCFYGLLGSVLDVSMANCIDNSTSLFLWRTDLVIEDVVSMVNDMWHYTRTHDINADVLHAF